MSNRQELEVWVAALGAYDAGDYAEAIKLFTSIAESSRIWFNIAMIYAKNDEHQDAVASFQEAIELDKYMAIAYFQQGVSHFLMEDYQQALVNFNDALLFLRGNLHINYEQLGLKFRLYSCEVLCNRGLCYYALDDNEKARRDLEHAAKEQQIEKHAIVKEALREGGRVWVYFILYRSNIRALQCFQFSQEFCTDRANLK